MRVQRKGKTSDTRSNFFFFRPPSRKPLSRRRRHVARLLQRRLQQHVRGGPQVRGDTRHRSVHGLRAGGRIDVVLLCGVADAAVETVAGGRGGPGRTVVAVVAWQRTPTTVVVVVAIPAGAGPGQTGHAAVAARGTLGRPTPDGRGHAVQGQTPVGRVRRDQPAVHTAVRVPAGRRVRADGRGRVRATAGRHGAPGPVVRRALQQTQAAARVPVRVQPGHVRAGHRRPIRPAEEHGCHTTHLQGAVVRVSGECGAGFEHPHPPTLFLMSSVRLIFGRDFRSVYTRRTHVTGWLEAIRSSLLFIKL